MNGAALQEEILERLEEIQEADMLVGIPGRPGDGSNNRIFPDASRSVHID